MAEQISFHDMLQFRSVPQPVADVQPLGHINMKFYEFPTNQICSCWKHKKYVFKKFENRPSVNANLFHKGASWDKNILILHTGTKNMIVDFFV